MTKQVYTVDGVKEQDNYNYYCVGLHGLKDKEFETQAEALEAAKKQAKKIKEDVVIRKIDSVVKFPEPDFTIENVA